MRKPTARLILESSETFVALLCTLSSTAYLSGAPPPKSIDTLLPVWLRFAWGAYLFVGGILTIVGLVTGLRWTEKAGLLLLAGSATAYAVAALALGGLAAAFPAGVTLAFALAFGVRASSRLQAAARKALRNG